MNFKLGLFKFSRWISTTERLFVVVDFWYTEGKIKTVDLLELNKEELLQVNIEVLEEQIIKGELKRVRENFKR